MPKYSIGLDYGTLSARALLLDLSTGQEIATSEYAYPHGVLEADYFTSIPMENSAALQHPQDYLEALQHIVPDLFVQTSVSPADICGIAIDFTASTVLPITEDGTPLCFLDEFKNNPHAYVKLWKHHSSQSEADQIDALAHQLQLPWLERCGGRVSSEWFFPKVLETLHKAPHIYHRAARFIEAGDWLTWQLTGTETHSSCIAGCKSFWTQEDGYPPNEFWAQLHPDMHDIIGTKVSLDIQPVGSKVGEVNAYGSFLTGLLPGTPVAAAVIDAHAGIPGAGVAQSGILIDIIGTSSCHHVLAPKEIPVPHICGYVRDAIIPGFVDYEAGQSAVGDIFDWFVHHCIPANYEQAAKEKNLNIHQYLTQKAEALEHSHLLVLDWWNGSRTPYADFDLSGMILGLNLRTRPEEIYRALIESTAYGTRTIVELFEQYNIPIHTIYAVGGIAHKNPLLMQIYADVLGREIRVPSTRQAGARGAATFAAAAGGVFADPVEAVQKLACPCAAVYTPDPSKKSQYDHLYEQYCRLSEYFAHENPVMKGIR